MSLRPVLLTWKQHDNQELLRSPTQPDALLAFLPGEKITGKTLTPYPLGFARNGDYVGLTCAGPVIPSMLRYGSKLLRIDGGQAMLDFAAVSFKHLEKITVGDDRQR